MSSRQNFSPEVEAALNDQVNVEFRASYAYESISSWCSQDGIALHGFAKYYQEMAGEERGHAQKLIKYINTRGGRCILQAIPAPVSDWQTPLNIAQAALAMERDVNERLLKLYSMASKYDDPSLEHFLEEYYLREQVDDIKHAADMVTRLQRAGTEGLGLYLFDRELLRDDKALGA